MPIDPAETRRTIRFLTRTLVRSARVPRRRVGPKITVPASTWRASRPIAWPASVTQLSKANALRADLSHSVQSELVGPRLLLAVVGRRLNVEEEATITNIATYGGHGRASSGQCNALGIGKSPPYSCAHQAVKITRP